MIVCTFIAPSVFTVKCINCETYVGCDNVFMCRLVLYHSCGVLEQFRSQIIKLHVIHRA